MPKNPCPTCGRARRVKVDVAEMVRLADRGVSLTRAADLLGVHRLTLQREATRTGVIFTRGGRPAYRLKSSRCGEHNGRAKITLDQAEEIRTSEAPTADLAELYGLSTVQINKIRRGASWK